MCALSRLSQARLNYQPKLPPPLHHMTTAYIESYDLSQNRPLESSIASLFPHTNRLSFKVVKTGEQKKHLPLKVGVVLSGGQAPGGHNVISGIYDALKQLNQQSVLFGFLDGPAGIVKNAFIEITEELLAGYRNQGGFDIIGSGRTKIETKEQFDAAEKTVRALDLDGLIIIGGDDSNTNAAFLAEHFAANQCKTSVVGVPKTIDGDLKNQDVEISFGFDSASKTYCEIIGNIMRDALSAKKSYYFIKLMGRSASHLTLECALQTHPNIALIAEEMAEENTSMAAMIAMICDMICKRAEQKKDYGVILIPEGVIEFVPEFKALIQELNALLSTDLAHHAHLEEIPGKEEKIGYILPFLSINAQNCFKGMPTEIQAQMLLGRDPHGNVQVSKIETERLILELVASELALRKKRGAYTGQFHAQPLFCGYEGRSCLPSNFDCQYCYTLGHVAALLVDGKANGYMSIVKHLTKPVEEWQAGAVPLISMMDMEKRHGKMKPVITKALVDLSGSLFAAFARQRSAWALQDDYRSPGPIQFFGPPDLSDTVPYMLTLAHLHQPHMR